MNIGDLSNEELVEIASAPDLYEACKAAHEVMTAAIKDREATQEAVEKLANVLEKLEGLE